VWIFFSNRVLAICLMLEDFVVFADFRNNNLIQSLDFIKVVAAFFSFFSSFSFSSGSLGLRPQLRAPDLNGHCRTSTVSSGAQWALPISTASGHCWTSTANSGFEWGLLEPNRKFQSSAGTAGP
jgi:hypothetical protein